MADHYECAIAYAKRDWPVLPLKPGEKTPLTPNGFKAGTTNERQIERWWLDRWQDANIGIATGENARFWVLDIDGEDGGKSLTAMEAECGPLPETLEQKTGGGGRHLLFAWPTDREIRNKQSIRPHIDVRGNGGYVVVPPSIHPNGQTYAWVDEKADTAEAPTWLLDLVSPLTDDGPKLEPTKRKLPPWERVSPPKSALPPSVKTAPAPITTGTPIVERAKLYLQQCDPAVQGSGGHDALLWAARALVVGFELDDGTATGLLWSDFNPRCNPAWDRGSKADVRDFERKIDEARRTPGKKARGWLLDEFGLRSSQDAMALIVGQRSAAALLAKAGGGNAEDPDDIDRPTPQANHAASAMDAEAEPTNPEPERQPLPIHCLPPKIAGYVQQVAETQVVDIASVGMSVLVVGGAAMGNAWRLKGKDGFLVPPVLWGALVGHSGSNKTGALRPVVAPLRDVVPIEATDENALLTPQGRIVVGDATMEAVIARMNESPRGLVCFRGELAGWAKGFNAYKKSGGDEEAWLEFYDGGEYELDRKTNDERIRIPAASVCVLGGIQPGVFAECFDPKRFLSGLVPRLLIAEMPKRLRRWSDTETTEKDTKVWHDAVLWLRTRPFADFDSNTGCYRPHVLGLSDEAKKAYVTFFNALAERSYAADERAALFIDKARGLTLRLALVRHGLGAAVEECNINGDVSLQVMKDAIELTRYFLGEQLRVYGLTTGQFEGDRVQDVVAWLHKRGGGATSREFHRSHTGRYSTAKEATADLQLVVDAGSARWEGKTCMLC